MRGALYVVNSGNTKLMGSQKIDATYVSIKNTCPNSCAFKNEGCYALSSFVGMINARMQRRAKSNSPLEMARQEAKVIDAAYNGGPVPFGRMLRLHVAGDSRTIKGTRVINAAIGRWKARGGGQVYSYTHAWKHVPRSTWSNVGILASVDNVKDIALARERGYAPALVVPEFASAKAFNLSGTDTKFIPCPAQTRDVGCSDCQLCMRTDYLYSSNRGIAFAAHGINKLKVKRRLNVIL